MGYHISPHGFYYYGRQSSRKTQDFDGDVCKNHAIATFFSKACLAWITLGHWETYFPEGKFVSYLLDVNRGAKRYDY